MPIRLFLPGAFSSTSGLCMIQCSPLFGKQLHVHGKNRCKLPEEKDVSFLPLSLMEHSRNEFENLCIWNFELD